MYGVPRLVLSALRGGTGKTTLAIGIIAAFRKRGWRVAAFKKGPDFIDAGWLSAAAGVPCYNLDPFLMEEEVILRSFIEHTAYMDAAVIEGNRGLYDGVDEGGTFSTAALAKLLKAPVILILDCTKATGTLGALALGCKKYDPGLKINGVILNNISSARHESVIRKSVEQASGIPVLGAVPRLRHGEIPERHMGLTPREEHPDVAAAVSAAGEVVEKHIDLYALWNISIGAGRDLNAKMSRQQPEQGFELVIGVIQDKAFQFYYPDNLEALQHLGAKILRINALNDSALPRIDGLYIGGGFPETQAGELAKNQAFCNSLKAAVENGLPVYAECGGLIYLGRSLRIEDKTYPMSSVLPVDFVLEKRPQAHGYTILEVEKENPFFEAGRILKGHEFHYSRVVNTDDLPEMVFTMRRGVGIDGKTDGLRYKNVLATYTHLHALGTPEWAAGLVMQARQYTGRRKREML